MKPGSAGLRLMIATVPLIGGGVVLCAAVDIHKHVFQAVVFDPVSG